jgi:hypothetical protein
MVIAIMKIGMKLGRLISVAYTVLASVLVVVQVVQSLGLGASDAEDARQAQKTRKVNRPASK